jgi:two-component system, LuxR family, response regulator FixJ
MVHDTQLRNLLPSIVAALLEQSAESQELLVSAFLADRATELATADLGLTQEINNRRRAEDWDTATLEASLAHDLNQPLGAIANYALGCLRRLESGTADKQALVHAFLRIAEQAERAGKISHRLRSFVTCNEPEMTIVDLNLVLPEVVPQEPVDPVGLTGCGRRLDVPLRSVRVGQGMSTAPAPLRAEHVTVYVVDEDKAMSESLSFLLEALGWEVRLFVSAQDFLARYSPPFSPACLLLEVRMRGMSGLDLQAVLGEHGIELPAIMSAACADVPMAVRAMHQGAVDFLEKPFNEQRLRDCIEKAVARNSDLQRAREQTQETHERLERLTPRERDVLQLMMQGLLNKQIASELALSIKTVEQHRARVMEKMEAESLASLVRMTLETGFMTTYSARSSKIGSTRRARRAGR